MVFSSWPPDGGVCGDGESNRRAGRRGRQGLQLDAPAAPKEMASP